MRAVVLDGGTLTLRDRPTPSAEGECLIRVTAAGICGTDLELCRGYAGFSGVPGHEFVGVVEKTAASDTAWIGKRVVGEITVGCERCDGCRRAGRGHCDVRTVLGIRGRDGAFAEYLSLPATNLHAVPDSIDDLTAVFAEPWLPRAASWNRSTSIATRVPQSSAPAGSVSWRRRYCVTPALRSPSSFGVSGAGSGAGVGTGDCHCRRRVHVIGASP